MFITCRGANSRDFASLLCTDLGRRFGAELVFLSAEVDPAGEVTASESLGRVVMVVLGPGWLAVTDSVGRRAIDDPGDRLRRELVAAFTAGARVVPVLIDDAERPAVGDLPDDVASLGRCQAMRLRRGNTADLDRLAEHAVELGGPRAREVRNHVDGDVSGTVVQAGSVSGGLHVHLPPRAPTGEHARRLPVDTGVFVGRDHELTRLAAVTGESDRVVVVAVHGLGGVGKSTLAARFAHLHAERFAPVWWVTSDSATAIDSGLAELAAAMEPASGGLPAEQRTELALGWLAGHTGWLLILDNLTTPADAERLLARVRTGTILITSRQGTGWRHATTVSLDVLAPIDAVELLDRIVRTDWPDADLTDGDRLCAELGWLPLAIEQAGAYIAQNRIALSRYLELLAAFPERMFGATAEGGDARRTMARVWHVTLDRLADSPLAGQVLRELAWYAPDHIPRLLLEQPGRGPEVSEALGRLAAYNMIVLTTDTISVHRLVQAVTRTPDADDPHRRPADITLARDTTAEALAVTLGRADARLPSDWPRYELVLPHVRALLDHTAPDADTAYHCALTGNVGQFLDGQGNVSDGITMLGRAATSCARIFGPDHANTLISRDNLAGAYRGVGDLRRAIPLFEATLADWERVMGTDHPDTLMSRYELACTYEAAGEPRRAIPLHEATLADRKRVLGADHRDTLMSRHDMAGAYESAGDLRRATQLYEKSLADRKRVLGADHPHTLDSRSDLAYAYTAAGDLGRAIPLFEAAIADYQRILGPEHPRTMGSRNNLACAYRKAGSLTRAIRLFETNLADRERVLGPAHPHTLSSKNNLANAYQATGDSGRAIALCEGALIDAERVLGPHHRTTEAIRSRLRSLTDRNR